MGGRDQKIVKKLEKKIVKKGFPDVKISAEEGIVRLNGRVSSWSEVITLGYLAAKTKGVKGVINDVTAGEIERKGEEKKVTKRGVYENVSLPKRADVVIVGGGVIGCFIARELSRYKLDVVLLEKESDVACEATKANSGVVHSGIGESSGTLKQKLNVKGNKMCDKVCEELNVPFERDGLLIVITTETLPPKVRKVLPSFISNFICEKIIPYVIFRKGKKAGIPLRPVKREELLEMEPNITDKAIVGVYSPTYGVVYPYEITIALAENAIQNGVKIALNTEVEDILVEDGKVKGVLTDRGTIEAEYVINAAGIFADEVAEMAGAREFSIHPRKGSIIIFDKDMKGYINHSLSELILPQDPHTKGGGIFTTVDGNPNWGPDAIEVSDKYDKSVTAEEIDTIFECGSLLPDFQKSSLITYFAGLRAATYEEDFFIKASENVLGFVNVAGIQSPGLASSPAIAEMVRGILREIGLKMREKEEFNPIRRAIPKFSNLSIEEKKKLIKENPLYGNVICRCEHVTEGEVVDAIHRPLPATTVDAVKRRVRAGMGRCQGGFCGPKVARLLARELNIPLEEVTKDGPGSNLFVGKTKSLLAEEA